MPSCWPKKECTEWDWQLAVLPGKETYGFICLTQSKIIVKNSCRFENPYSAIWRFGWERKLSQDHLYVSHWPSISCPSHTSVVIWRDSYLYWVLRNNSPVHSIAVTGLCETLVLTSSSSTTQMTSPFFIIPLGMSELTHFRLPLGQFLVRSHGFLEFFSNSLFEHLWPPLAWPSQELSDLSGFKLAGPPWATVALFRAFFCHCLTAVQLPCLTVLRTFWSERTQFRKSSLAFMQIFPRASF